MAVVNASTLPVLDELQSRLAPWCRERPVELCAVFGSRATGHTHAGSDLDLAVRPTSRRPALEKLTWMTELAHVLGEEVDLVLLGPETPPVLGMEVVRNGRLLWEREPGAWDRELSRLWLAYVDSFKFRQAEREQLREFAERVRRGA